MAKALLGADYGTVVFTPGGAGVGTVVISNVQGFNPADVFAIIDVTRSVLIYNPVSAAATGTWSSLTSTGGTLTLAANTTGYAAGDVLQVLHNTGGSQSANSNGWTAENVFVKSDEGNNVDDDSPKTQGILPAEAYGMVFNDTTQKWDRTRGDKYSGQGQNLMADGGGYLQTMIYYLGILARAAPFLTTSGFVPVSISGNQAINIVQVGGQSATVGQGPSTTGTQRTILSQDSFYPLPPMQVSQYISCS